MRGSFVVLAVMVANCGGGGVESSEQASRPTPGTATLRVAGEVISTRSVDRVTLEVATGGRTLELTVSRQGSSFTKECTVDAGLQTLTVTAYSGRTRVGHASIVMPFVRDTAARAYFRIVDTSRGWPATLRAPAVNAFFLSPTAVLVGEPVSVGAQAIVPSGEAITYTWTSDCSGTFGAPASATSSWSTSVPGKCALAVHATSRSGTDVRSDDVTVVGPTGNVDVTGSVVAWPVVRELAVASATGVCDVLRSASDASCRNGVAPGEPAVLTASLEAGQEATFEWSDDCGGVFAESDRSRFPEQVTTTWTAPAPFGPGVCLVRGRVSLLGMVDELVVAVLVTASVR